jgi:hypothetical protein
LSILLLSISMASEIEAYPMLPEKVAPMLAVLNVDTFFNLCLRVLWDVP